MAEAVLSPLITSINGRIGNTVFYTRGSKQCVRTHVVPRNPDTALQRAVRHTFADAVRSWQNLQNSEKQKYRKLACRLNMSGYNYYISLYISRNSEVKTRIKITSANKSASVSYNYPLRFHSVSAPILPFSLTDTRKLRLRPG